MQDQQLFDGFQAGISRTTLTKLCGEIARSLARVGRVAVEGEVVKPVTRPSGWTYFTLADRAARLPIACPAQRARRCLSAVHGSRVLVTGSVVFSTRNGQLHLEAEEVLPVGEGAIEAAIAATRIKLAEEGILDRPRQAIPLLPRSIGVVCGAEAAVRGDIESVVAERFLGYPVVFRQVAVSGPGAVDGMVSALRHFSLDPEVEVVIMARGGGDPASLFPFSAEDLCREIAAMPVPVVTAIGHERDHPLCDEVSDLACNTPSLAAIRVVPDEAALRSATEELIMGAGAFLRSAAAGCADELVRIDLLGSLGHLLQFCQERLAWCDPAGGLANRVEQAFRRLAWADLAAELGGRLDTAGVQIEGLLATLEALSPVRVLRRGYAVVRTALGTVIRSPDELATGDSVAVEVAGGRFGAVVSRSRESDEATAL